MDHIDQNDRVRSSSPHQQAETRRQRQLLAVTRQMDDLTAFLNALEGKITALRATGHILEGTEEQPPRFMDYARTRNLISECLAFMIVIERRVQSLPDDIRPTFQTTLDQLTIALWSTLLDCSLAFLRAISEEEHLPLGSREVFLREIKTLYDAHGTLSRPEFESMVPKDIHSKQRAAERILNEIIDRAPRLLDLS